MSGPSMNSRRALARLKHDAAELAATAECRQTRLKLALFNCARDVAAGELHPDDVIARLSEAARKARLCEAKIAEAVNSNAIAEGMAFPAEPPPELTPPAGAISHLATIIEASITASWNTSGGAAAAVLHTLALHACTAGGPRRIAMGLERMIVESGQSDSTVRKAKTVLYDSLWLWERHAPAPGRVAVYDLLLPPCATSQAELASLESTLSLDIPKTTPTSGVGADRVGPTRPEEDGWSRLDSGIVNLLWTFRPSHDAFRWGPDGQGMRRLLLLAYSSRRVHALEEVTEILGVVPRTIDRWLKEVLVPAGVIELVEFGPRDDIGLRAGSVDLAAGLHDIARRRGTMGKDLEARTRALRANQAKGRLNENGTWKPTSDIPDPGSSEWLFRPVSPP